MKGTTRKIGSQEGGFLDFFRPLMTAALPLMKNVLTLFVTSALVPWGLTAAASATDAAIQKKIFGSGMTAFIISNEEINDIMQTVKSLEKSGLLIIGVSHHLKMNQKNIKAGLLEFY